MGLTTSLTAVFILKIVFGFVEHTPILNKAIIGDVLPKEKHRSAYISIGVTTSLGIIIGPIIGGHLVEVENGFFYVCTLAAVICIMIIGITQTFPEKKKKETKASEPTNLKKEFLKIFVELLNVDWKTFGDALYLRFILSLSVITYFTNQTMYLSEKYDLPKKSIGYIIALFGALGIIATVFIPLIKTKFYKNDSNSSKFLFHQFVVMTASFLALYLVTDLKIFIVALVPLALANAALNLVTLEVILNRATDDSRGSLTGVSESVLGIGRCIAPLASGIVAGYFGESNVLLFAFLSSMSGVFVCFKLLLQEEKVTKNE